MAQVRAYEVAGELWPVSVEVRLKPAPCWHDVEPLDQDPNIEWERSDYCDCWPDQPWPRAENVPSGGLPVRLLRNLRMSQLLAGYANSVRNQARFSGGDHPLPAVARHFRAIEAASERPKQRGRPNASPRLHLRRLAVLDRAYAADRPQDAAARSLGIAPQTLRATLEWARRQEPPLWTRSGRGRRGHLTPDGKALIAEVLGDPQQTNERKRLDRRARLPEPTDGK